jgi:UDP-N-acetylglucosamine transferase subunit ALG13
MIFVVVGTQEPFDRLIKAIDKWAGLNPDKEIFGQISYADYKPVNFEYTDFISPPDFNRKFEAATLIVGHAGMGTIIQALQHSKPIIVMPRLARYHETRNDHQYSTAKSLGKLGYVHDIYTEEELFTALDSAHTLKASAPIGNSASESLLSFLKDYIMR